jgi:AcrR family transcriptional regulator
MTRPLRKDAADRRANLLTAARAVFAEDGIDAPLDRIAERAGVGRATLYRNFPGRTEIALAVLLDDVAELGERFAEPTSPDAFLDFIAGLSDRLVRNTALGGVVRAAPSPEILKPLRLAMVEAAMPALKTSQAAGVVRADLAASDIRVLSAMLGAGLHNAAPRERNMIAARSLEFVLDAVRAVPGRQA